VSLRGKCFHARRAVMEGEGVSSEFDLGRTEHSLQLSKDSLVIGELNEKRFLGALSWRPPTEIESSR